MFAGIQNKTELSSTPLRSDALDMFEEALKAIDTSEVIRNSISIKDGILSIKDKRYALKDYGKLYVVGFGKASCDAAAALEEILGSDIDSGVIIDVRKSSCGSILSFAGTHPHPSEANVEATKEIIKLAEKITEKDLVIVIVSGGGSALLAWPESEWKASEELYERFLRAGGTIRELNLVRRHLSELKGGGLAKLFYPATLVGLIFSDVPGGTLSDVASGPTFFDDSTKKDAKAVLEKYHIDTGFELLETPKEKKFFDKVENVCMMENMMALQALRAAAEKRGYKAEILSDTMYDFPTPTLEKFFDKKEPMSAVIGGGEARLIVEGTKGTGGRNLYLANAALELIKEPRELFVSLASDGIDNCESAGGIADLITVEHCRLKDMSISEHLRDYDCLTLFKDSGDAIITGTTGSNVSDIMLYLRD